MSLKFRHLRSAAFATTALCAVLTAEHAEAQEATGVRVAVRTAVGVFEVPPDGPG
jgi:hypothetical protein